MKTKPKKQRKRPVMKPWQVHYGMLDGLAVVHPTEPRMVGCIPRWVHDELKARKLCKEDGGRGCYKLTPKGREWIGRVFALAIVSLKHFPEKPTKRKHWKV